MAQSDRSETAYEAAFHSFMDFIEENDQVLLVCVRSIRTMDGLEELTRALKKDEAAIEAARKLEELVQREVDGGFQLLLRHASVAIWAALDASVPRFVASYLQAFPELLKSDAFAKVRLPAAAIMGASDRDVWMEIVAELERNAGATLKMGVGRFECLLDAVGLSRAIDGKQRRDLLELSQARNLIVHQFGVVDARFASVCAWLGVSTGDKLTLSFEDYHRYRSAACLYVAEIVKTARNLRAPKT